METSNIFFTLFLTTMMILYSCSYAMDTLHSSQSIRDGETLVSSGGTFELGFFSPGNSTNRYLGIWYRNPANGTIVWVANRVVPIANTTGVILNIIEHGILRITNSTNGVIWSSNSSRTVQNPIARLLDSGNLVVTDASEDRTENFIWQSFSDPSDTYLPGMRFGRNLVTGLETYLFSTRSLNDPAPGEYTLQLDPTGYPQIFLRRGSTIIFRIGPWNGAGFSGTPSGSKKNPTYNLTLEMNENEISYRETNLVRSVFSRYTLSQEGLLRRWTWVDLRGWRNILDLPTDQCDHYGVCGAYGICDSTIAPSCICLDRFVPRNTDAWGGSDWTDGCVRRRNMSLSCTSDVFLRYSGIKLPDARYTLHNSSTTLGECRNECLRNCSCTAYTLLDKVRKSGCLMWYNELRDIRSMSLNGQDIYIRMASSESISGANHRRILIGSLTLVIVAVIVGISMLIVFLYIQKKRKRKNDLQTKRGSYQSNHKDFELPLFDLSTILTATNDFSFKNKIGKGGFGIVYKGMLEDGQEIAVKRLSKDSMQGVHEFKSEVIFIAKLQHRNLVKLLGCCIEGEESMLIYEYMCNKSLDFVLFDKKRLILLDWQTRFNIIIGVARGLLYLHQDSRLRIIHRDLKASNVLLDSEMNPKISDFGLARSFGGKETEAITSRVVGTYGYMPPEYAVDGLFSVKSDVYSFGVLILEIVSGMRNRGFAHNDHNFNLLGHAWMLSIEGRSVELVDASLGDSFTLAEVLRSIHVGLLCVQQNPDDRPNTSSVVLMLSKEGVIPEAKRPGFFTEREVFGAESSTSTKATNSSTNEMSITVLDGR